jgi:hypothetical protein
MVTLPALVRHSPLLMVLWSSCQQSVSGLFGYTKRVQPEAEVVRNKDLVICSAIVFQSL